MIKKVSENRIFRYVVYSVFCIMIVILQSLPGNGGKTGEGLLSAFEVIATVSNDSIYSQNAVAVRVDNGDVVFEKNSTERVKIASLTKIMTACVALEEIDFGATFTFDFEIIDKLKKDNLIRVGFEAGEMLGRDDLLYATLLASGADGAEGLALMLGEERFVGLMNLKAKELGMSDTHFSNPIGIDAVDNFSSAGDMAKLLRYAMTNDDFVKIISSNEYRTRITDKHPNGIYIGNTVLENARKYNLNIIGGKSGYTGEAGLCLAVFDERNIIIVLNSGRDKTPLFNFADALALYNSVQEEKCFS